MPELEKIISALENCTSIPKCYDCPWDECSYEHKVVNSVPLSLMRSALELLKELCPKMMTPEEVMKYLADSDEDKKPLWLEWHSIPKVSKWVLEPSISELIGRYLSSYNVTWRLWTSRPSETQRDDAKWDGWV